jgi:hypothetical protein
MSFIIPATGLLNSILVQKTGVISAIFVFQFNTTKKFGYTINSLNVARSKSQLIVGITPNMT